ncbi:cytochrome c oxidase subunit 3 family protein [Sandaracinus amylolyticus]|uniref:cytochrome c oxidase subunit 3 family protein n=1 Tax=Sandaracinus amylolyticus TaxID=927083 RepID=UPI001F1AA778|nr:cytochrome c oxidase subunit 3 family protein [Sandaracinus amylolyticus]UJR80923.1 Cytochrome c oxidase polypeptide III [Sandaracinus amylolyticus]
MATPTTESAAAHDEHAHGSHGPKWLQHHFDMPVQQFEAAKLGMWAFLAQEILFFSGLFVAYAVIRQQYPEAFAAGSHQLDKIMGGINTIVLLFSSLTAALSVRSAQLGKKNEVNLYLGITILCAFGFLIIKYFEYSTKIEHGLLPGQYWHPHMEHGHALFPAHTHVFFGVYFMLTGLHGLHVAIGIGILAWIMWRNNRGEFSKDYWTPVDLAALYWHLVDLIWIYLFPLLYLI